VGTAEAPFQPMVLTVEKFREHAHAIAALPPVVAGEAVNLTAGPVAIHPDVAAAFHTTPIAHRSPSFDEELRLLKSRLCAMTSATNVAVLLGSGTLANDVVAAQARDAERTRRRLQQRRVRRAPRRSRTPRGTRLRASPLRLGAPLVTGSLDGFTWAWLCACETSTGMLNAIEARGVEAGAGLRQRDRRGAARSLHVWLASGASGKALASYPGLSFVFYQSALPANGPRYLDLELYARDGVPFTHSSNLIAL
jgi:hypothetical protein